MSAIESILSALRRREDLAENIASSRTEPAREADTGPFPDWVLPELRVALAARGITSLYSHQRLAVDLIHAGRSTVIATSTSSGKSLCYHLPVLDALLRERASARALYLFPTKALSRDQMADLESLLAAIPRDAAPSGVAAATWPAVAGQPERGPGVRPAGSPPRRRSSGTPAAAESPEAPAELSVAVYDGDTPPAVRRELRDRGHLVLTNPHMLHTGILPNHTRWQGLFTGLRFVVIDEVHTLSGVYGSHVANVIRRLKRICAHYGSSPVFVCSSATISNPGEHARALVEEDVAVVDRDGSPRGARHFVFYNPPVTDESTGARAAAMDEVRRIAELLLAAPCQTIYFANTRRSVEVLLKYLRDSAAAKNLDLSRIMGYRGGYLPDLRRGIEQGLRAGEVTSVVATNALELGIDIGRLDCCVMLGYPGTVSSTFQRAGRVGRRRNESLVLMVARSFAMDQYVVESPDYLFDAPRETVAIDPENLIILASHLKCATFELPFRRGDPFGRAERVAEILDFLTDDLHLLVREGDRWHFAAPTYPADGVSLSAAEADNVVIFDADARTVLAEVDRASAITEVHEGAVYGHQGEQFLVEELDFANRRARVRKADVDYYTEAEVDTDVKVLHVDETVRFANHEVHLGEVHVATLATGFKKIRFYTRENIGAGDINLPPEEMETEAAMLVIGPALAERTGLVAGGDPSGLRGVAALVQSLVPLFVRTDPGDVRVKAQVRSPHFQAPALILYDRVPNGVGLSEALFRGHRKVLEAAHGRATRCPCRHGCPGCTGPGSSRAGKRAAIAILDGLLA